MLTFSPAEVTFLFSGPGSQYPGMGRGLYESEPVFRAEVDRCAEHLAPRLLEVLREAVAVRGWPATLAAARLRRRGRWRAPEAAPATRRPHGGRAPRQ